MKQFSNQTAEAYVHRFWDTAIIPTLKTYIEIPNLSPQFDTNWQASGHMLKAAQLLKDWCNMHALKNTAINIIQEGDRTPLLLLEISGEVDETVLIYGHFDKQPEMTGWRHDLAPFKPVIENERLYGRGSADDGYAIFAAIAAIKALQEQSTPHARCVILIEGSEESGSPDLPFYIDFLKDQIGTPDLIICLDSGCGDYQSLWVTTSLRGLIGGTLSIKVLREGIHSGMGSGVVPSPFRILRQLLSRIENTTTGEVTLEALNTDIPPKRVHQAQKAAAVLDHHFRDDLPFAEKDIQTEAEAVKELILRRTWKPALSVTGIEGLPTLASAGNVTIPFLKTKLSLRLPPNCDPKTAQHAIETVLQEAPPYQANVHFEAHEAALGWQAPEEAPWLTECIQSASQAFFNREAYYLGEGGSIPFMGMLGQKFPNAQFVITGVLGPESNAHGPNEFLHLPTAKKLTCCIAYVLFEHYLQKNVSRSTK